MNIDIGLSAKRKYKCLTTRFIHHSGREAILLEEIPAGNLQEKPNEAAPTATAGVTAELRSNTLTLNIFATCMQLQTSNMSGHTHDINLSLKRTGEVVRSVCSCKAGLSGSCKHVVGVFYLCRGEQRIVKKLTYQ